MPATASSGPGYYQRSAEIVIVMGHVIITPRRQSVSSRCPRSTLNPHSHFHCVVVDGVFDAAAAGDVIFHTATVLDATVIAEVQAQVRPRLARASFVRRGLLPPGDALARAAPPDARDATAAGAD